VKHRGKKGKTEKYKTKTKRVHNREETTENKRQNGNDNQGASELQNASN
jgi:hypothetical protein